MVELPGVVGGLQIDLAGADTVPSCLRDGPRSRIDRARCSNRNETVCLKQGVLDGVNEERHLSEPDDVRTKATDTAKGMAGRFHA